MTVTMRLDPSTLHYPVEIRPELAVDGTIVYISEIPDLQGCMSHGSTIEEARENLEDAKREYLAALQERGLPIPAPSPAPVVGAVTWTIVPGASVEATGSVTLTSGSVRLMSRTEALEPA